jgi:hypothetical protein
MEWPVHCHPVFRQRVVVHHGHPGPLAEAGNLLPASGNKVNGTRGMWHDLAP